MQFLCFKELENNAFVGLEDWRIFSSEIISMKNDRLLARMLEEDVRYGPCLSLSLSPTIHAIYIVPSLVLLFAYLTISVDMVLNFDDRNLWSL